MDLVSVRYMVNDVQEAIEFYTRHFDFELRTNAVPAFAGVVRGRLRLLVARARQLRRPGDARRVQTRARRLNRIHFVVADIQSEVERLRSAGVQFRNEIVTGPGGSQILLEDPSGNPIELFQRAG